MCKLNCVNCDKSASLLVCFSRRRWVWIRFQEWVSCRFERKGKVFSCKLTPVIYIVAPLTYYSRISGNFFKELFGARASQIINSHAASAQANSPFFIYLAFQSVHAPLQVRLCVHVDPSSQISRFNSTGPKEISRLVSKHQKQSQKEIFR